MNRSSLQLFGRIALITVLVVLAIWLLRRFLPALAWAAVLAIASWPARQWLIDKGVRRSIAALLLTVLVGALIVGPLLVLAVQMAREAGVIVQGFRDLKENGLSTPEWVSPNEIVREIEATHSFCRGIVGTGDDRIAVEANEVFVFSFHRPPNSSAKVANKRDLEVS